MQEQTNIPQIQIESIKSENIVDTLNKLRRGELSLPNSERQIQETANALSNAIVQKETEFAAAQIKAKLLTKEMDEVEDDPLLSRIFSDGENKMEKELRMQKEFNKLTNLRIRQQKELNEANKAFSEFLITANVAMNAAMVGELRNALNEQSEVVRKKIEVERNAMNEQLEIVHNRLRAEANAVSSVRKEVEDTQNALLLMAETEKSVINSLKSAVEAHIVTFEKVQKTEEKTQKNSQEIQRQRKVINKFFGFFRKLFKKEQVAQ